ncbi:MAG: UDP-N-acetylglucosamine--N-acetylmuramyl-(pentapeptide) pyrophosphoryl-undecaprenol N-acetylglucosamine transferase [Bdellovibrionota bacterium]
MKYAVLVAGGTGGHINAALAVGEALKEQNYEISYLTGKRALDYKLFQGQNVRNLDSKPLRTNNPVQLAKNILMNLYSFVTIFFSFMKKRPQFIVGAGGYVCGPTLLAGYMQGIPVFIIEQNAVMGLTNKILGWISGRIFVHFTETQGLSGKLKEKVRVVGNPTRKSIQPVPVKKPDEVLKVLVFGGSLGASQINDIIFDLVKSPPFVGLSIHHQIGFSSMPEAMKTEIDYVPMAYIDNMQKEYEWCDVIIARSGASTVSELAIIKKPVLIIPFPQATDNHQWFNAEIFRKEADYSVEVLDPKIPHADAVKRVVEFLRQAHAGQLRLTKGPGAGNSTCDQVLKEIRAYVGMA